MFAVIAAVQTIGTASSSGSAYADRGVGLAEASRANLPMNRTVPMYVNNKTGRTIRLNYLNQSCLNAVECMDARSNRTSRDVEKNSNRDKQGFKVDVPVPGPKGPAGSAGFEHTSEHERSRETDRQRGCDEGQKFSLREDPRLQKMLDHEVIIPSGFHEEDLGIADHGLWFVQIFDRKKTKKLAEKIVGYEMKYIEIIEVGEDFRIVTKREVPSHLLPPSPCPHCLPIEDRSKEAMQKLANTCISFKGRTYYPGNENDKYIDYTAQDHHDGFISLRKSLIGKQNPFLLFKLGEPSRKWFESKDAATQDKLLQRVAKPGLGLGKHMELIKVPERTTPFTIKNQPMHIVGQCPHCNEFPNRHAMA